MPSSPRHGRKPNATNGVSTSLPSTSGLTKRRRCPARRPERLPLPEGHTLHRLARLPQRRFASAAAAVDGRVLRRASVWGKHLFHHYADGPIVHVHLGLYGTFTEWSRPGDGLLPEAVGQVRMRMVGADYGTDLRGPTVCELIDEAQVGDIVARLGPDPLRADADPSWAWARITQ